MLLVLTSFFITASEVSFDSQTTQSYNPDTQTDSVIAYPIELVSLGLSPSKQIGQRGEWTSYEVIVRDSHYPTTCIPEEPCPLPESYEYELSFNSKINLDYQFSENIFTLKGGELKSIKLSLRTKEKGIHDFTVYVEGPDSKAKINGVLVIGKKIPPKPKPYRFYFLGKGYALHEDGVDGKLIRLGLLKKSNSLIGKISIENESYEIKGKVFGNKIEFDIWSYWNSEEPIESPVELPINIIHEENEVNNVEITTPGWNEDEVSPITKIGKFSGKIRSFFSFKLLRGTLEIKGEDYKLTIISIKNKPIFTLIEETEAPEEVQEDTEVQVDEVLRY